MIGLLSLIPLEVGAVSHKCLQKNLWGFRNSRGGQWMWLQLNPTLRSISNVCGYKEEIIVAEMISHLGTLSGLYNASLHKWFFPLFSCAVSLQVELSGQKPWCISFYWLPNSCQRSVCLYVCVRVFVCVCAVVWLMLRRAPMFPDRPQTLWVDS